MVRTGLSNRLLPLLEEERRRRVNIFNPSQTHPHRITTQIFLDNDDYLNITQYCIDCGKVFRKRRIKTEQVEEGGDAK